MKKLLVINLLFISVVTSFAQQQKFDLITFTPPNGWKNQNTESALQFTKEDAAKGTYCIITLMKAIPGSADAKGNFDAAWETVVKEMVKISVAPEMQPVSKEEGWEAQTGYAPFELDGTKGVALLVTSTGYEKMVNILVLTNTNEYETELTTFLGSVILAKPTGKTPVNPPPGKQPGVKPAPADGYKFSSTNFDDGWKSEVQNDWVLVSKGDIKVYLWYALPYDYSKFSGTGLQARHYYWDNYVTQHFTIQSKKFDNGGFLSELSQDYIEGWATDKATGEKKFIAMRLSIAPNTAYITLGTASAENTLRQQFPNAADRYTSDLAGMSRYNKFAVSPADIIGKWENGNTSTAHWYYVTPSGYESYAGMTLAATSDVFVFNNGDTYSSIHNGATGAVGNMSTFQQNYKGKYTVSEWSITATNRWQGKTDKFDASFMAVRGGRILNLNNNAGSGFSLVKVK